ncbi:MAG: hypothetical protein COB15_01230 [Flavobacteriales bacterium]|nr:MAG: hypothetical protein COB15_01230 [Flavobacteriales bacterium]
MENIEDSNLIGVINSTFKGSTYTTTFYAANKSKGKELLATDDEFFNNQSPFDRFARINISDGLIKDMDELKSLYVSYVQNQVSSWTEEEISCLKTIIRNMNFKYKLLKNFKLPKKIYIVKTTGHEEGAAAYTRQFDTIVLPENMIASLSDFNSSGDPLHPAGNTEYLESIITHESFHIFSKNCFIEDIGHLSNLYKNIGYQFTGNTVILPDVKWPIGVVSSEQDSMSSFIITNPDSPTLKTYMTLQNKENEDVHLMPLLLASSKYNGGAFFEYLKWYTIEIEKKDGKWVPKLDVDNYPITHLMSENSDLMNQYLEKVGYNLTNEIFQGDEVLAQTFVNIIEQNNPSQWVLSDMLIELST